MKSTVSQSPPLLVTLDHAAELLSVSRSTVYRMTKRGELRTILIGSKTLVEMASLTDYIKARRLSLAG